MNYIYPWIYPNVILVFNSSFLSVEWRGRKFFSPDLNYLLNIMYNINIKKINF